MDTANHTETVIKQSVSDKDPFGKVTFRKYILKNIGDKMDPKSWIAGKIDNNEFSMDEFIEVLFPTQPKMRDCANQIINYLKEKGPASLNQIIQDIELTRGTAYDTVKYLKRWGILERSARYAPLKLSRDFSKVLRRLADFWDSSSH